MARAPFVVKTISLSVLLVVGGCVTTTTSSQAAVRTKTTLSVSTTKPITGERYVASGRVSTRFKRPVVLRSSINGAWRTVRRSSTSATGTFRFPGLSSTSATRYTVLVPSTRRAGRSYTKVVSSSRSVRPVRQSASLDVLPRIVQQGRVPAPAGKARSAVIARFSPVRPGRKVTIQRRLPSGSWQVVRATTQAADGTASYSGSTSTGTWSYPFRARVAARTGAASLTTTAVQDTWGSPAFSDEFTGTKLDETKWSYRRGATPSRTRSTNDVRSVSVGGGTLRMRVLRDPAAPSRKFLNGQISTAGGKFAFTYGTASARIKFPKGRGQHGSFWLQSPMYSQFPGNPSRSGAEIDAVEFFGSGYPKGGLATFLYYQDKKSQNVKIGDVWSRAAKLLPKNDTWWSSYHVFSVNWTPKRYTFYVDGRVLFTTTRGISKTDEYLILSLLTSDWEIPDLNLRTRPNTMSVDWARVWQSRPAVG